MVGPGGPLRPTASLWQFPSPHRVPVSPVVSCRPLTAGLDQGPECRKDPSANKEAETQGGEGVVLDLLPGHASQNWAPSLFPGLSPGPAG